jgi:hypothetical protein
VQLGLENKKKTIWAAVLGALAILAVAYQFVPMFTGPSSSDSSAQAAAPVPRVTARTTGKPAKKVRSENLDPTLRLELLASSEQTEYHGSGRNIFISQADPVIPIAMGSGATDQGKPDAPVIWHAPSPVPPPPIPLQFYGFASRPGEPKKIFLKLGGDVWVAGEGDTVDLRYKVIRIMPTSVEILDSVTSSTQNVPLTQG